MPLPAPKHATVGNYPGANKQDIENEPEWHAGHNHRIGYRNNQGRIPGHTSDGGWGSEEDIAFAEEAMRKYRDLRQRTEKGDLINFQDVMKDQTVRCACPPYTPFDVIHRNLASIDRTYIHLAGDLWFERGKIG